MSKDAKTLVLLDAHAIIHRAYHALPEFLSSKGEPTGALYGLSTMIMRIVTDLKPDYIVACYDLPGKTFRHEAYDGYKAGRVKAEDALVVQLKNSRQIFDAFNIPIYDSPGFEADDVIGTIVEQVIHPHPASPLVRGRGGGGLNIIIASGDMDTMQLVDDKKVQVFTLKSGINETILYDEEKVIERFGFKPALLPDYKGLRGDASDNIKGIKGIGEKTAGNLIVNFGTIENIYKKIKKDGKALKKLGLTERMAELIKNNEEEALFSKTLAKIRTDAPIKFTLPKETFWQGVDQKKIERAFTQFEFRSLFSRLKSFFQNSPNIPKQPKEVKPPTNLSFEYPRGEEKVNENRLQEASIALWLINSDIALPKQEDILSFAGTESFDEAYKYIFKKLKEDNLEKVYEEIEFPLIHTVNEMAQRGILIDKKYLENLSQEYHKELDKITSKIYKMAGTEFNINSPKQLGEVLFGKMGIKAQGKKGASGAFSTKFSVLEELEVDNPIIRVILAHRELQKLLSTYIDVIPKMVAEDGRLHAKFLQNGSTTGRFSSQDPNLQNLPIKTELGKKIRGGFIAGDGYKLCAFDYSQIELRVAAILSGDAKMTKIFEEKKDVHAGVASFVFSIPIEKVTAEMRRKAKVINFGIIYGMGVTALRKNLGGTREEAQKFYNNYFNQFSGIRDYMEEVKKFAYERGYTETLFGRRRYFPNIRSKIPFLKNMAERTAINAPVQGTAADIIKLAIRFAEEDLKTAGLLEKVHLVLQIHDELVYEIEESVLPKARIVIERAMQEVLPRSYLRYKTKIPLEVRSGAGKSILEVK